MSTIKVDPRIGAFFDLIAWSEATSTQHATIDDGYDVIVTGVNGLNNFTDYSVHPFLQGRAHIQVRRPTYQGITGPTEDLTAATVPVVTLRNGLWSTASGRYQIILPTWEHIAASQNLGTFSPTAQDLACLELLTRAGAVASIVAAEPEAAVRACSSLWASFPGNNYGQGGNDIEHLMTIYKQMLAQHAA